MLTLQVMITSKMMAVKLHSAKSKRQTKVQLCYFMSYSAMFKLIAYQPMVYSIRDLKWLPQSMAKNSMGRVNSVKQNRCLLMEQTIYAGHFSIYLIGPSKKLAKNAAAKAALATLRDISFSPMQMKSMETAPVENNKKQSHELPQTFADSIGKYVVILIGFDAN